MKRLLAPTLAFAGLIALYSAALNAQQTTSSQVSSGVTPSAQPVPAATTTTPVVTTGGKNGLIPVFSDSSTIVQSLIYQYNGGIGIGTVPSALFDVNGTSIYRGILDVARTANATPTAGTGSWPFRFSSQQYNSSANVYVNTYFQLQAEPTGNNTASTGATLNLQYYNGGGPNPAETGFYFNPNGTIHFAASQTFPITTGATGPAGPQGPTGPAGPAGPKGAQGPAGTIALPYSGSADGNGQTLFSISNTGVAGGAGISGTGATAPNQNYTAGGAGLIGKGGAGTSYTFGEGGNGATVTGGTAPTQATAGDGIDAYGGDGTDGNTGGFGIFAQPGNNGDAAGFFNGDVQVQGNLSKAGGSFKIDHPLDPANKYLYHSFVESPDMMNIYNGNIVTDGHGEAVVTMPTYFEALNRDFRYQLTTIGSFSRAMVSSKISNGRFTIRTEEGNVEVSWQVTGVRQDAWANAHRIPNEEDKSENEKGHYIHPELFGHKGDPSIAEIRHHRPQRIRQQ